MTTAIVLTSTHMSVTMCWCLLALGRAVTIRMEFPFQTRFSSPLTSHGYGLSGIACALPFHYHFDKSLTTTTHWGNSDGVLGLQALHDGMDFCPPDLPARSQCKLYDRHQNAHHDHTNHCQRAIWRRVHGIGWKRQACRVLWTRSHTWPRTRQKRRPNQ